MIAGLSFAAPLALAALVLLPALWYLLRVTPPPPQRQPLPTLELVKDLASKQQQPARTPLWLLLLRLAAAAALIFAMAGPRWQPQAAPDTGSETGTLVLMLDDGWPSARDWGLRIERARAALERAASRPVLLLTASQRQLPTGAEAASAALPRLLALQPNPHFTPREAMLTRASAALTGEPGAQALWISDGLGEGSDKPAMTTFLATHAGRVTVLATPPGAALALVGAAPKAEGLEAILRRAQGGTANAGLVQAFDAQSRVLGEASFAFDASALEARALIPLPLDLANAAARLEITSARTAGAVHLLDGAHRRRRVALISGETVDTAQPLVSPRYFLGRALEPYAELREPPPGTQNPIQRMLEERPDVMVLAEVGTIPPETLAALTTFVEKGGVLVRFASASLADASDALLPVRLRRGGRVLGGALSWEKPRKLGPIPEGSPFTGVSGGEDVRIERQVLAEPDAELTRASWAVLEDGTPLITGATLGTGRLVLFHVTADTRWSNLPLSRLYVEFLRRTLQLARSGGDAVKREGEAATYRLAPRANLDGFGALGGIRAGAEAVVANFTGAATALHPPGFYGPPEGGLAVNTLDAQATLQALDFAGARRVTLESAREVDLRPWLLVLAVLLFALDGLAMAALTRALPGLARAAGLALALLALPAPPAEAQGARNDDLSRIPQAEMAAALKPRLAYVITGDSRVDEISKQGLTGLTQALAERTAAVLEPPVALDPGKDELVFYPLIYWPMLAGQKAASPAAARAIDTFMKQGGTVLFDTRDAFAGRPGGTPTPETRSLRALLASLDIPALEPVPADHVLTKTFYLLSRFVGRYAEGETWVEQLSGTREAKTPARAGDRVSPIIITSNDFAAAWAGDAQGRPLYPLSPGDPRQREMALRAGVNLVMYVMTGNYKADQVHVPALLERLGQ